MTFLPIVERELRVSARQPITYWVRFAAAACLLLIWLTFSLSSHRTGMSGMSHDLFTAFGVVAFGFCLSSGIFLTADCLSEEKREGTLGLLFLTDLRGYDVILGKLLATSMRAFYALLAVFPILALTLLMGGVTLGEFFRMAIVAINTLLFSLSVGIWVSSMSRSARAA